ncbi:hypothetical protein CTAYLR_001177 [Chrysophaeum taylorii]|uniref:DNA damage-binding protein 1 n=1 Tax=Chrysophaeum taylorii TaxID=2483200 RepID=A0AAD7URF0_9STRA|nr:hypothetical protein CTAYLR_001177 [Chrysophaeum taylorii]
MVLHHHRYVATAKAATAVTHCGVVGRRLVVAKGTTLEAYRRAAADDGLELVVASRVCGRIAALLVFRSEEDEGSTERAVVVTEQRRACVMSSELETLSSTDLSEFPGGPRTLEAGKIVAAVDRNVFACHVYDGLLKCVGLGPDGSFRGGKPSCARLTELRVIDLCFSRSRTLLCALHDDGGGRRHVSSYEVGSNETRPGPWVVRDVDPTARFVVAPGDNLLLVIGERELGLVDLSANPQPRLSRVAIAANVAPLAARAVLDDARRWVVGDEAGNLYCAMIVAPRKPRLQVLGKSARPSCLAYLGDARVFVGSAFVDSKVATLGPEGITAEKVVIPNLGPILDACVVQPSASRRGAIIAACHGGLRVLREGVQIEPRVWVPAASAPRGLWEIGNNGVILVTYAIPTSALFSTANDELERVPVCPEGLRTDERTVFCGAMKKDWVVQVTPNGVASFSFSNKGSSWWACRATLAACDASRLIVALCDKTLRVLEVPTLTTVIATRHGIEPSCLAARRGAIAWADWSTYSAVYHLRGDLTNSPTTTTTTTRYRSSSSSSSTRDDDDDDDDDAVTSIAFLRDNVLVVGSLSGVHAVDVDGGEVLLSIPLGRAPARVWALKDDEVLCAGDRAVIVSSTNNTAAAALACAAVHLEKEPPDFLWAWCCAVPLGDGRLAISGRDRVALCSASSRGMRASPAIPGGGDDQPRCVCHSAAAGVLAVGTAADLNHATKGGVSSFLSDVEPYDRVSSFDLDDFEEPLCCRVMDNNSDSDSVSSSKKTTDVEGFLASLRVPRRRPRSRVVFGTSVQSPGEFEPSAGRVLVFSVSRDMATLEEAIEARGAVYDACPVGPYIAAAVNHAVVLYDHKGRQISCFEGFVVALGLASPAPNRLFVGDLMRSVALLQVEVESSPRILEVARDYAANWISAIAALTDDDSSVLCAEASHNLVALRKNEDSRSLRLHLGQDRLRPSGRF